MLLERIKNLAEINIYIFIISGCLWLISDNLTLRGIMATAGGIVILLLMISWLIEYMVYDYKESKN